MKCPKCRFENTEGAKFCRKCGNPLDFKCPLCQHSCQPDSIYCEQCGHDLRGLQPTPSVDLSRPESCTPKHLADKILSSRGATEGERKLVTVLFADVAGWSLFGAIVAI